MVNVGIFLPYIEFLGIEDIYFYLSRYDCTELSRYYTYIIHTFGKMYLIKYIYYTFCLLLLYVNMCLYHSILGCMLSRYFRGVDTTLGFLAQRMLSRGCPRITPSYQRV